ncbi:MAG: sugar ABC transporter substrate-binding protein [Bacillota bacterium]
MKTASVKVFLAVMLSVALGLVLCAGTVFAEKTKVKIAYAEDVSGHKINLELFKAFEEKYPNLEVEAINIPEKYWDKLLTMFAGGTAPDVVYMNYMNLAGFADKGVLEDLMPWIEKSPDFNLPDFFPSLIKQVRYKGRLYELPKDFTTSVLYYNKDMFKEAGIKFPDASWTWDDFRNAAKALTKDKDGDGRIDQYGWDGLYDTSLNTCWIWQNGGEIIDSDGRAVLDSPQNIEAYQFVADLILKDKVAPDEATFSQLGGASSMFASGRLAMRIVGRWETPTLAAVKGINWDVAPLPHKKARGDTMFIGGWSINSKSPNKEAAWKLVQYLTGTEGQKLNAKLGLAIPSRKSIASTPVFLESILPPASNQVFLDAAEYGRVLPITPYWQPVYRTLKEAFYQIRTGKKSPEEALREANASIAKILKGE